MPALESDLARLPSRQGGRVMMYNRGETTMLQQVYSVLGCVARRLRTRGRRRLANVIVRHPATVSYRDNLGYRRHTDFTDILDAYAFLGVDCGLPRNVMERIPRECTVVDVGANIGIVAAQLCRRVGVKGTVHAVEPLPANLQRLRELMSDNDLPQLVVWACAVADSAGSATLRTERGEGTSGHASFTASWIDGGVLTVPTRTLDEVVPIGTMVSFVKLDVEGAEALALDGARRILSCDRPLVFCELNDIVLRDAGSSASELLAKFGELGYEPDHEYRALVRHVNDKVTDILFAPA